MLYCFHNLELFCISLHHKWCSCGTCNYFWPSWNSNCNEIAKSPLFILHKNKNNTFSLHEQPPDRQAEQIMRSMSTRRMGAHTVDFLTRGFPISLSIPWECWASQFFLPFYMPLNTRDKDDEKKVMICLWWATTQTTTVLLTGFVVEDNPQSEM